MIDPLDRLYAAAHTLSDGASLAEDALLEACSAAAGEEPAALLRAVRRRGRPGGEREAVVAVDLLGLGYEEAGSALGVSVGTVLGRLYRGRERLAARLAAPAALA